MSVYRIYVEKKPEFAVEANSLIGGIKSALGLENLTGLRVINRYDAEGLSREDFDLAAPVVFSEPAVDVTYDHLPAVKADEFVFAVEYLPGQFDQRADSCAQCISLLTGGKRPTIKSARIYIVSGKLTEAELDQIKHYMINPVESREASLDCFDTLDIKYTIPTTVKTVEGFIYSTDDDLRFMLADLGLAMDFDDMLCKTVELFQKCPDILEFYQNQFKYIMVDEYQDTNKVQYKFVSMLAAKYGNICVVGDDDQSIYKFRGATIENILSFENTFKGAKMIRLEQNYRSTQNILNAANGVISNNTMRKGKTLWTENAVGDKIEVHTSDSERDEAQFIAKTILDGVADGRKFSDFAILYRMNAQSNSIEQALSRSGIPHRVIGGRRFYDREEIRDMVAYLQVINNPHDDVRLGRIINVPKRGIGATTLEKASEIAAGLGESIYSVIKDADVYPQLSRAATKLKSFVALIDGLMEAEQSGDYSLAELYNLILEHTDYEKYLKTEKDNPDVRIENIEELSSNIIKFEEDYAEEASLSNFLEEISLQTDIDNYDAEADSSVMMTLHSAKGLEFPVVFIAGLEEGVFPSIATMMNPDELNEERRLAYVGITRAKEKLYITKAKSRMLMGHTSYNKVSRFVNEIPPELLNYTGEKKTFASTNGFSASSSHISIGAGSKFTPNKSFNTFTKPAVKSGTVYKKGDCVFHKVFGKGMIMKTEKMGNDTMLEVAFDKAGTKTLMANFSKMEKI